MYIGNLKLETNVFLAPLAGYTDLPFRIICENYGCEMSYTEMINAKALCRDDETTLKMLDIEGQKKKVAVQIFGSDPDTMGKAAHLLTEMNKFALIDINMGCPVPKVVKNGEGSALMKNQELSSKIVEKVVSQTDLPVTVKIRKGFDKNNINAVEFAKEMERAGAKAITVHGRLREEYFSGEADLSIIKEVKENVSVPVIGNGDVFSLKDKNIMLETTKCDAVMIGRGAIGNPFIFSNMEIEKEEISDRKKIEVLIKHYKMSLEIIGERKTCTDMRKHINAYLKGIHNSTKIKNTLNTLSDTKKVLETLEEFKILTKF